jgi:hypothetical protein
LQQTLPPELRCPLGRETAIQKMIWSDDGWLRLAAGETSLSTRWKSRICLLSRFRLNQTGMILMGKRWITPSCAADPLSALYQP